MMGGINMCQGLVKQKCRMGDAADQHHLEGTRGQGMALN